jgi:hypothetical protein
VCEVADKGVDLRCLHNVYSLSVPLSLSYVSVFILSLNF